MPLEGLRAWIGEVERKLGMRTRVFLVLSVIALGGAGAAIYLAVDAREDSVSESDVRELQEELEARIAADAASAPTTPEESAEPAEPAPDSKPAPEPESEAEPESGSKEKGDTTGGVGTATPDETKLKELVEQAKQQAGK